MKRIMKYLLPALIVLAGCGGASPSPGSRPPARATSVGTHNCKVPTGSGVMGICTPQPTEKQVGAPAPKAGVVYIPDLSEWNGTCAVYSEAIIRIYEAGLDRLDSRAACLARALAAKRVWWAVYSFLRPSPSCVYQADRTVALTRSLGVPVVGPVVADAEVWLPAGFVTCWIDRVEHDGLKAATYTSPGTWAGGSFASKVWIAAYPYLPRCFSNACPYVAHQFSSSVNCRGSFGDCSINEGILAIHQGTPPPKPNRHKLIARREVLRYVLSHDTCRTFVAIHVRYGEPCTRWYSEGTTIEKELK